NYYTYNFITFLYLSNLYKYCSFESNGGTYANRYIYCNSYLSYISIRFLKLISYTNTKKSSALSHWIFYYSCPKASIGSIFAALFAGRIPKIIPINMENKMPIIITGSDTREGHPAIEETAVAPPAP